MPHCFVGCQDTAVDLLHTLLPIAHSLLLLIPVLVLQCKNMVQPHRALATFVYLAAIAGTLAVAFSVRFWLLTPPKFLHAARRFD